MLSWFYTQFSQIWVMKYHQNLLDHYNHKNVVIYVTKLLWEYEVSRNLTLASGSKVPIFWSTHYQTTHHKPEVIKTHFCQQTGGSKKAIVYSLPCTCKSSLPKCIFPTFKKICVQIFEWTPVISGFRRNVN